MRVHDRVVVYGLWLDFAWFLAQGATSFTGAPGLNCIFVTERGGSIWDIFSVIMVVASVSMPHGLGL